MSDSPDRSSIADSLEAVSVGGDALIGLATLGKTAAALGLVLLTIFALNALLKRLQQRRQPSNGRLTVISAIAVGPRERVVIVEVASQWLVLGVAHGQVNKLHELPAPSPDASPHAATHEGSAASQEGTAGSGFAAQFASALKQRAGRHSRSGPDRTQRE